MVSGKEKLVEESDTEGIEKIQGKDEEKETVYWISETEPRDN